MQTVAGPSGGFCLLSRDGRYVWSGRSVPAAFSGYSSGQFVRMSCAMLSGAYKQSDVHASSYINATLSHRKDRILGGNIRPTRSTPHPDVELASVADGFLKASGISSIVMTASVDSVISCITPPLRIVLHRPERLHYTSHTGEYMWLEAWSVGHPSCGRTVCPSATFLEMNISPQDSVSGRTCIAKLRALALCAPACTCKALRRT